MSRHTPPSGPVVFFFFHNFSLWTKSPDVFEVTVLFRKGRSVYVAKSVFIRLTHCFWGARYSAVLKFVNHFVLKKYLFYIMFFFIYTKKLCAGLSEHESALQDISGRSRVTRRSFPL